jgi:hypothetical protein
MSRGGGSKGLGLFTFALALGALGEWLVWQPEAAIVAWRQVLGWLLFLAGGWLLKRAYTRSAPQPEPESLPLGLEAALLVLVLAGAVFLRLHDLNHYPSGGFRDEGENGNVAIQLMNGDIVDGTSQACPAYIEHNTQNAAGYFYPVAVFFKLFGISITSVRYVSVLFGVLSVAAFWALARWFFGPLLGLFLTACLAAMRWHLNFSRIGFLGIMSVFLSLPMLLWLYKGLRAPPEPLGKGRRRQGLFTLALALAVARGGLEFFMDPGPKEALLGLALGVPLLLFAVRALKDGRSRWLMLSAVALALAMYSYIAARLFVVLVALVVGHHLLTQQRQLKARVWLFLFGCLGVIALGGAILVLTSAGSASNAAWSASGSKKLGELVVGLGVLGLLRFWWTQRDLLKGWYKPLGLALGVGLVVAGPLYSYSVKNQREVAARSYRVSIFNDEEADRRPWGAKLLENLGPTMGMMNVRGDGNPRHNYPNAIMVNWVWAALFGLGIFYALLRLSDPRAWLALTLWQISLIAGYASIEAPQAYRCISAIPAVLLFMGLVLERGLTPVKRWLGRDGLLAGAILLLPVLAVGAGLEIYTYFVIQPTHPGVWAEFSTGEYMMGQDLKALNEAGRPTRGLVKPDWADSYTFRFMTYPERNYEYFDVSRHVPIRPPESTSGSDFLYILGQSYKPLVSVLQSYYPHGEYKEVHHPLTNELLYWTYHVSAADAASAGNLDSGLMARYYVDVPADKDHPEKGPHWVGNLVNFTRLDPFILFDWSVSPVSGWFSAEWTGFIKAPLSGDYLFDLVSNSYGLLEIDGKPVVERAFQPPEGDERMGKVHLSAGKHRIRLRYYEARNYSRIELWWTPPKGFRQVVPSMVLSTK